MSTTLLTVALGLAVPTPAVAAGQVHHGLIVPRDFPTIAASVDAAVLGTPTSAAATRAGSTMIAFDAPGAGGAGDHCDNFPVGTYPTSINPSGTVTGYLIDSACSRHAFVRTRDGQVTVFDAPGAVSTFGVGTSASAINPDGVVVGYYADENIRIHAFVRTPEGHITSFDAPGVGTRFLAGTKANGIDSAGDIVGEYSDNNLIEHGYLRHSDGTFVTFDSTLGGTGLLQGTIAFAVNDAGTVAGCAVNGPDGTFDRSPFLRASDGTITALTTASDGSTVRCPSNPAALNNAGTLVGNVGAFDQHSPEGYHNYAFSRSARGAYQTFDAVADPYSPCCTETFASSVNDEGQIVGDKEDAAGVSHGWLRDRSGAITPFDAPGAGTGDAQGTVAVDIATSGWITGYSIGADGVRHGYIRTP